LGRELLTQTEDLYWGPPNPFEGSQAAKLLNIGRDLLKKKRGNKGPREVKGR